VTIEVLSHFFVIFVHGATWDVLCQAKWGVNFVSLFTSKLTSASHIFTRELFSPAHERTHLFLEHPTILKVPQGRPRIARRFRACCPNDGARVFNPQQGSHLPEFLDFAIRIGLPTNAVFVLLDLGNTPFNAGTRADPG